ncbi:hypothetical protein JTB14_026557 [Gonioctena quinquepunctata]|nr:hypothetical protein JTB14_026557 [Gonioctena quinquepunctata]
MQSHQLFRQGSELIQGSHSFHYHQGRNLQRASSQLYLQGFGRPGNTNRRQYLDRGLPEVGGETMNH